MGALGTRRSPLVSEGMNSISSGRAAPANGVDPEFRVAAGATPMAHDIHDDAIRVSDKKSPDPPWLVGQRIHNRVALLLGFRVTGFNVLDLDTDIRVRLVSAVGCDDTHLRRRIGGRRKG